MLGPAIIRFNVYQRYSFWIKRHWNLVNVSINKQTISQCDSDRIIGVWPNIGIFTLYGPDFNDNSWFAIIYCQFSCPVLHYQTLWKRKKCSNASSSSQSAHHGKFDSLTLSVHSGTDYMSKFLQTFFFSTILKNFEFSFPNLDSAWKLYSQVQTSLALVQWFVVCKTVLTPCDLAKTKLTNFIFSLLKRQPVRKELL